MTPSNHDAAPDCSSAVSDTQTASNSQREQFFNTLKQEYPNLHALYLMVCITCVWSGIWYLADTWAQGGNLVVPATAFASEIFLRHAVLLLIGLLMLYMDDKSLQELILMKKTEAVEKPDFAGPLERIFCYLKRHYPNAVTIYTLFGIILAWCGTWGLILDIPVNPFWRSLATIAIGFILLYIDDFKLDEL